MLEFNPDGSLKLTSGQIKQNETEKKSVVITREQISVKPAKAQIRIRFPDGMDGIDELINFYYKIDDSEFTTEHSI